MTIFPLRLAEININNADNIINRDRPDPDRYASAQVQATLAVANATIALAQTAEQLYNLVLIAYGLNEK